MRLYGLEQAVKLAIQAGVDMLVFGMGGEDSITRALRGERIGTLVTAD